MNKQIIIAISILVSTFALHAADVVVYPRTTGTPYSCPIPKTGQTVPYVADDDGALQKGITLPVPRFTVGTGTNGTNCVTDNLTGLMWARNANLFGSLIWTNAITSCSSLDYGGYTDWRLPNINELLSLSDWKYSSPVLSNTLGTGHWTQNDPFTNVQMDTYWSSTSYAVTSRSWRLYLSAGIMNYDFKYTTDRVWPVRGGQ